MNNVLDSSTFERRILLRFYQPILRTEWFSWEVWGQRLLYPGKQILHYLLSIARSCKTVLLNKNWTKYKVHWHFNFRAFHVTNLLTKSPLQISQNFTIAWHTFVQVCKEGINSFQSFPLQRKLMSMERMLIQSWYTLE